MPATLSSILWFVCVFLLFFGIFVALPAAVVVGLVFGGSSLERWESVYNAYLKVSITSITLAFAIASICYIVEEVMKL